MVVSSTAPSENTHRHAQQVTVGTSKRRNGRLVNKTSVVSAIPATTSASAQMGRETNATASMGKPTSPGALDRPECNPQMPLEPPFSLSISQALPRSAHLDKPTNSLDEGGEGGCFNHDLGANDAPNKRIRESAFEAWMDYREETLDQMFVLDGLGEPRAQTSCSHCLAIIPVDEAVIRCVECLHGSKFCRQCIVKSHQQMPLHITKVWNKTNWVKKELHEFGLVVPLGHNGGPCRYDGRQDLITVLDVTGCHHLNVRFCACTLDPVEREDRTQLLRCRLFPASFIFPKTAFTFRLLDQLTLLTGRGRTSMHDLYSCLRLLTDPYDLLGYSTRYEELNAAVRRYRDLLMHKRAGRGNVLNGMATTPPGGLALECPALPFPERNMPEDWRTRYAEKPYLKALYLAADANFRHKQKERAFAGDPGLIAGSGFFVQPHLFEQEKARVENLPPQKRTSPKSTCESSFSAVERADTRVNRGFCVTGVVAVIDSRYGFLLPNSVADLQKGERYFNTDLAFLSAVQRHKIEDIFLSYDIVCRWGVHSKERWEAFPPELRGATTDLNIRFAIPKFHLPAHGSSCWSVFSFNFIPGSGRVDGEAIERFWATSNPVATSSREMGTGTRHDFLEERWGMSNFQKLAALDTTIAKRLQTSVEGLKKNTSELRDFSASFPESTISEWTRMVHAYHQDPTSNKDPYQTTHKEFSTADVEKDLRTEEANEGRGTAEGTGWERGMSELDFVITGLDLEYHQRKLRLQTKKDHPNASDTAGLGKSRATLGRRILNWIAQQDIFMPGVSAVRTANPATDQPQPEQQQDDVESRGLEELEDEEEAEAEAEDPSEYPLGMKAEDVELYLPSHEVSIAGVLGSPSMIAKELRLRISRMEGHLKTLRHNLCVKASVFLDKRANVVGQVPGTRSNMLLARYNTKIEEICTHYQGERLAAVRLDPTGPWQRRLRKLTKVDVRPVNLNESDTEDRPLPSGAVRRGVWHESRRNISWIWKNLTAGVANDEDEEVIQEGESSEVEIGEALQVEWAKTYARKNRYEEEVELVIEEMKRVRRYFRWKIGWWKELMHAGNEVGLSKSDLGKEAYAQKQVYLLQRLDTKFANLWRVALEDAGLRPDEVDDLD